MESNDPLVEKGNSSADDDENGEEIQTEDQESARHKAKTTTSYGISIDSSRIKTVPVEEQSSVLRGLGIDVFNQEEFEEGVLKQVDEAIAVKETEALIKGWEKELKAVGEGIRTTVAELEQIDNLIKNVSTTALQSYEARQRLGSIKRQKENKLRQLQKLEATQKSLHHKLGIGDAEKYDECDDNNDDDVEQEMEENQDDAQINVLQDRIAIMKQLQNERDKLIKTGKMTSFGGFIKATSSQQIEERTQDAETHDQGTANLSRTLDSDSESEEDFVSKGGTKIKHKLPAESDEEYIPEEEELKASWDDREVPSVQHKTQKVKGTKPVKNVRLNVMYESDEEEETPRKRPKIKNRQKDRFGDKPMDDGDDNAYLKRIRDLRIQKLLKRQGLHEDEDDSDEEDLPDMEFDDRYKVPGKIWHKLYKYQQTGVKWLWELHCQQAGGIIGDEMGLGKTIQAVAFLAGLKYSKISSRKSRRGLGLGAVLIVCPVTVLHQWVREFHRWWPNFRVAVLHDTGSFTGTRRALVKKICTANGVLVTSYSGVRSHQEAILAQQWEYVFLDEGHKIRNPDAEITLACKQIRTPHRIILSGSPMQNNLRELWSLFDFVFPGKLGTLPVFMTEFSVPITTGGYANASKVQVQTAYKCACVLRDTINPYLLRRLKKDVKMDLELPNKNEQVLFCRLSDEQRQLYEEYLDSREVQSILAGNYKVFPGLIMLRKICNHPDLTTQAGSLLKAKQDEEDAKKGVVREPHPDEGYGDWRRAGKMVVVEALLKMWKVQGHRVLLFSQTRQMLNILEQFVNSRGYNYRRMDGSTSIGSRQPLVNKFNQDKSIFVFLLTTRVGGLGINLTGADRVLIYDPDWNPSTDTQARERSWRIGQTRQVTIYRLLTTGTIEEKIYHRQIFKQFLTNRVLEDPKQRRFFKTNDLYELFTLDDSYKKQGTETGAIFAGTNCEVKVRGSRKRRRDPRDEARAVGGHKQATLEPARKTKLQKAVPRKTAMVDDGGAFSIDFRDIEDIKKEQTNSKGPDIQEKSGSQLQKDCDAHTNREECGNVEEKLESETESALPDVTTTEKASSDDRSNGAIKIGVKAAEGDTRTTPNSKTIQGTSSTGGNVEHNVRDEVCDADEGTSSVSNSGTKGDDSEHIQDHENTSEKGASKSSMPGQKEKRQTQNKKAGRSRTSREVGEKKSSGLKPGKKKKLSSLSDKELRKKLRVRNKKRQKKIEGHVIEGLDHHEVFSAGSETEGAKPDVKHDQFILKALFEKSGVHSALQHDVIMESGNADYTLVENEANRVAQQAVQALKKSRQRCLGASSGVPTWTGASGSSGLTDTRKPKLRFGKKRSAAAEAEKTTEAKVSKRPQDEPLFSGAVMGMETADLNKEPDSSTDLLTRMRARNNILPSDEGPGTSTQTQSTEHDALLAEMSEFVSFGGKVLGQATTDELVARFRDKLPRENSAVFRALLRQICDFSRGDEKEGIWRLKGAFR